MRFTKRAAYDLSSDFVMCFSPRMFCDSNEGRKSEQTGMRPIVGTPVDGGRSILLFFVDLYGHMDEDAGLSRRQVAREAVLVIEVTPTE